MKGRRSEEVKRKEIGVNKEENRKKVKERGEKGNQRKKKGKE